MTVVDTLILRNVSKNERASITYGVAPMRYNAYREDSMYKGLVENFAWPFYLLSIILPVFTLIGKFVTDKTSHVREKMKNIGLKDFSYYSAYFIFHAVNELITAVGCTLIVKWTLYPHTDCALIVLLLYGCSLALFPIAIIFG